MKSRKSKPIGYNMVEDEHPMPFKWKKTCALNYVTWQGYQND